MIAIKFDLRRLHLNKLTISLSLTMMEKYVVDGRSKEMVISCKIRKREFIKERRVQEEQNWIMENITGIGILDEIRLRKCVLLTKAIFIQIISQQNIVIEVDIRFIRMNGNSYLLILIRYRRNIFLKRLSEPFKNCQ